MSKFSGLKPIINLVWVLHSLACPQYSYFNKFYRKYEEVEMSMITSRMTSLTSYTVTRFLERTRGNWFTELVYKLVH